MLITLYNFKKRYNSTKVPTGGKEIDVRLKEGTSLYTPSFLLTINPTNYTYVKYSNRYYYISDIIYERTSLYRINCNIDVLASYKSNILSTTCYIAFSQSQFDDRIVDTRLSTVDRATYKTTSAEILVDGDTANPTFILEYVTSKPLNGLSGVAWLNGLSAIELAGKLSSEEFKTWLTENEKELSGAYDSVIGLRKVPFNWSSTASGNIYLASWNSTIPGGTTRNMLYECSINIPWQFSDFRNQQPFTSLMLYLPAHGFVELNPSDLVDKTSIDIRLMVDGITGAGTYVVENLYKGDCNFANDISIGTIKGNSLGVTSGALGVVSGLISGNFASALNSGIQGAIASQQRSIGTTGRSSGGASIYANFGDWKSVYLTSICHNTNQEPSSIASTNGRPLNINLEMSSLSGYVQTINASVSCDNDTIAKMINELLDGGVFIE